MFTFFLGISIFPTVSYSVSKAPEKIIVKVEDKEKYLRIFFHTNSDIRFSPVMDGAQLNISFNKDIDADFQHLDTSFNKYVKSFIKKDTNTISLNLHQNQYAYRKFLSEDFVGIDLIKNKKLRKPEPEIKQAEKKPIEPLKRVVETTELNLVKQFEESGLGNKIFKSIELAQNTIDTTPESLQGEANLQNKLVNEEVQASEDNNEKVQNTIRADEIEMSETDKPIVQENSQFIKQDGSVKSLFFNWENPVGASIFQRGAYLWVVFDKYYAVDTNSITAEAPDIFEEASQLNNKYYTILRFKLNGNFFASPKKQENNWIISLTKQKTLPEIQPEVSINNNELHGSTVNISGWGQKLTPIRLTDPAIGDEMIIIPYKQENSGFKAARKYTDFVVLPTYQGVSINLISDFINFNAENGVIEISGPTNKLAGGAQLALRELQEKERLARERAEKLKRKGEDITTIKFNTWKVGNEKSYLQDLKDILWEITEVDWRDKSKKRLKLAQFYFAHELYPESLSVIETIKEYDSKLYATNSVKIVEAASLYMYGRYDEAIKAFNQIDINSLNERGQKEIKFWTAAANIELGNQIKIDKFISNNPIYEQKEGENKNEIEAGDEASNTRLIYETSSRLLRIIRQIDPEFVNSEEIQKLESTARFVTDHYQEAIKRFEESDLYKSSDAFQVEENRLWWSATDTRRQDSVRMDFINNVPVFLKFYPDKVFNDFALIALENRLKRNDVVVAEEILSLLKPEEREFTKNSIEFLRGLFFAKDEETEKAIAIWQALSENIMDRYNRTRAELALTIYQLRLKNIQLSEAIERLNGLRASWRGGVLEFNILKMLGEFYMEEKEYMKGFTVWRSSIAAFPGSDESLLIAKKMSDKFVQIFSQGEVDEMPKLDALTLYYEFRELTPIGKLGDEMISRLADRLIEVDLLERAAALLTHQIRFRLIGEERDLTALKLVDVHLKNRDPKRAYDVLMATENDSISDEIRERRGYVKAETLIELGKNNKTLALLRGDDSQKAAFLRADVYWRNKVWKKVIDELETPFREIRREERKVNESEMDHLIKLAVSYALMGRKRHLQVLYEDFEPLTVASDRKKVFTFVATDRGPVDYRNLDRTVEFGDMQKFLDNYLKVNESAAASAEEEENGV